MAIAKSVKNRRKAVSRKGKARAGTGVKRLKKPVRPRSRRAGTRKRAVKRRRSPVRRSPQIPNSYHQGFFQAYQEGYNAGFNVGMQEGHQLAYEQQP